MSSQKCVQLYVRCPHRNVEHGSYSTYRNHGCRCVPCRAANTENNRLGRIRRAQLLRDGLAHPIHGSEATYFNYRCRCEPCREAHSIRQRERRY